MALKCPIPIKCKQILNVTVQAPIIPSYAAIACCHCVYKWLVSVRENFNVDNEGHQNRKKEK